MFRRFAVLVAVTASFVLALPAAAATQTFANPAFQATWARTDLPVAVGMVDRTWMWGPLPNYPAMQEAYAEAPGGSRTVQYFDKTRMEDNSYRASSPWDVTNGLLAEELMTGRMQLGDNQFEQRAPAQVNVAGDAGDPNGPTYASFDAVAAAPAATTGAVITSVISRAGSVSGDGSLAAYGVKAQDVGAPTHHTVASVFWSFMNSTGLVSQGDQYVTDSLFLNPFYATGYPLTEAYWATVQVGGVPQQVLTQVFERRVLTYTPGNPGGWQVEAGNVGQHYYSWRYGSGSGNPSPPPSAGSTTFADGTFQVGVDVAPGTYHNSDSSRGCYWERLSGFDGIVDEIIANDLTDAQAIVTISPGDAGFHSEDCGTWTPDTTPLTASPTASFGSGTYRVGRDIAPGTWKNSDSSQGCYWARLSGFGGTLDEITANDLTDAQAIVTISADDVGFSSQYCGTWTRIGS